MFTQLTANDKEKNVHLLFTLYMSSGEVVRLGIRLISDHLIQNLAATETLQVQFVNSRLTFQENVSTSAL
ncbi:hypothetical protein evm_002447 [Chilo suppressalis]|nr:hypothetical protein evm_002447 [Chilo suppressalis]